MGVVICISDFTFNQGFDVKKPSKTTIKEGLDHNLNGLYANNCKLFWKSI